MKDLKIGDILNSTESRSSGVEYAVVGPIVTVDDVDYVPTRSSLGGDPGLIRANFLRIKPVVKFRALVDSGEYLVEETKRYDSPAEVLRGAKGEVVAIVKYADNKVAGIALLAPEHG